MLLVFAHFNSAVHRLPFDSEFFPIVSKMNKVFTVFYMPAFFIISGYCSNFNKKTSHFFKSMAKSLLVPLISFSVIDNLFYSVALSENFFLRFYRWILEGAGFWFLYALFIGKTFVFTLFKTKIEAKWILLVTFVLLTLGILLHSLGAGVNLFYYRHAMIASFWIAVGVYLKENNYFYLKSLKLSFKLYPFLAIMSLLIAPTFTAGINVNFFTIPLHLLYSFVGSMFLLALSRFIDTNRFFQFWGRNSLVVYGFHFPPLLVITAFFWDIIQPSNLSTFICFLLLLYLTEYSVCWIIMKIFEKKPFSVIVGSF